MATVNAEHTCWVSLLRPTTGDAVSHFTRALATFFVEELPFDGKGLSDTREVEIVIEFGGGPDLSGFDSSMVWGPVLNKIRLKHNATSSRTPGGNGQNRGESVPSALGSAGIGDFGEKGGEGLHLVGFEHDFGTSCTIGWFENPPA
jgi:hypothetical protein